MVRKCAGITFDGFHTGRTEEVARQGVSLDEGLGEGLVADGEPLEGPDEPPVVAALNDGRRERGDVRLGLV
jgi:hypothetical protein